MRNLLTTVFLLLGLVLAAQGETILTRYTMAVSFADVTSLTTTTHRATLNAQSDQLGEGYLANQIQVGYRVLTSTKRHFEVTTIDNASFGSATVVLTEIGATTLGPNGSGVLYDPGANGMIPPLPANATGVSQALLANMLIHNFEVAQTLVGGSSSDWADITNKPAGFADDIDNVGLETVSVNAPLTGNGTPGSPISYTPTPLTWNNITGKPTTFPSGDDVIGNEDNGLDIDGSRLYTTRPDGSRIGDGVDLSFAGSFSILRTTSDGLEVRIYWTYGGDDNQEPALSGDKNSGYLITIFRGQVERIEVKGSSATANESGEFDLTIRDESRYYQTELYDLTNDQRVDVFATGNVPKQTLTDPWGSIGGATAIVTPNIGGNYPNGFVYIFQ